MGASSSTPSSSTATHGGKFDLFISFRGDDIRDSFISHLHDALSRKKIDFFVDENLQRGAEISPELSNAIEESRIALVIFSKNYASSKWCLSELVKILECRENKNQIILPVFYHVNPSDVRKQKESFADAFVNYENVSDERKQAWRAALTKAANLCGWNSSVVRPESKLVDEIVKDVSNLLNVISPLSDFRALVGISSPIEEVKSLLDLEKLDFRVVGIWGMGGIGKTTLIGVVFEQISSQFEGCFFANIRKESEKCAGLVHLRNKIVCKILEDELLDWDTPNIPTSAKHRLQKKKVFIVLDDVDNWKQLEILTGGLDQFGPGSRVIVTTRDKQLLHSCGIENIYEVEALMYSDSLQLFCKCAFKHDYPPEDLVLLVDRVIKYAKGNPLALKVLGSSLNGKSKQEWESALEKLQRSFHPEIYDVLKISFDGLDDEEKDTFLDIACFYRGEDKDYVAKILGDCYYSLSVLVCKSLITISKDEIKMHNLLQEMGREIVRKESSNKPGNRSRLWKQEDALRALKNNDVTDAVRGIFLDMSKIEDIYLSSLVFEKMNNLRFLKFYFSIPTKFRNFKYISKVQISNDVNYFSDELRSFRWEGCPLKILPSSFDPEKLVELALPYSNVEQLWEGTKQAPKLKWLILRHSQQLTKIPDLSQIPLIENIDLEDCKSLLSIYSSIPFFDHLHSLNLSGCENLKSFPSNIHFKALERLDLRDCINLSKFPEVSGNIKELFLRRTGIEEVPSSIQNLNKLVLLDMSRCTRLTCISTSICIVKSLYDLNLRGCSKLKSFPKILEIMECWEYLCLSETAIKELPPSIEHLNRLKILSLLYCKKLEMLPSSLCNLRSLTKLSLFSCSKLDKLPENLGCLKNLQKLECAECRGLATLPPLSGLCSLRELILDDCSLTEIPEDIVSLSSLEILKLDGNFFESFPKSMKELSKLISLTLNSCNMLQSLTNLPSGLTYLDASDCKQLCQFFLDTTEFEHCINESGLLYFSFINCLNLNHKAVINVFEELLLMIQKGYEERLDYISIYIPGSEIPASFSHQSSGSMVKIQMLLDNWWKCKGFALCAILGFEEYFNDNDLLLSIYCYFETSDLCTEKYESGYFRIGHSFEEIYGHKASMDSNHMLLAYGSFSEFDHILLAGDSDHVDVSFEFKPNYIYANEEPIRCEVKYCAVHPIYAEVESISSVKIFGNTIQDIQGTSRWRSGKSDDHDKEVESHPKRICTEKQMLLIRNSDS